MNGDLYEIYYNGAEGIIKIEYLGKVDKDKTLEEMIETWPKIEARYEEASGKIIASASLDGGSIKKIELIYKDQILENETKTTDLDKEQNFDVRKYGVGLFKIKATGSNGKTRSAWVKASNLNKSIKAPTITLEPTNPNGEDNWYKRTKEEGKETEINTKIKVKITANNTDAEYIYYTAIRWI